MKPFLVVLALLLPSAGFAACTNDLPGRGTLDVFAAPTGDGVIGGIAPRQCGLEVTDFCENGRCLAFYNGLSGYIDVTGLQSGAVTPPPTEFVYDVTRADGTLEFMGTTRPFDFGPGTVLSATPAADHIQLFLPEPFPRPIKMTSTGSSGWEAILPEWIGVPVPVILYLDRLSAPKARLELQADHEMLKMDVILHLTRQGGPARASAPASEGGLAPAPDACAEAEEMSQLLYSTDHQDLIGALKTAVERAGITRWEARTPEQCREFLRHLDAMDIRAETISGGPALAEPAAAAVTGCDALQQVARPILRGAPSAEKTALLEAMLRVGVTSLSLADEAICAEIAKAMR